jgi:hypothetical protein
VVDAQTPDPAVPGLTPAWEEVFARFADDSDIKEVKSALNEGHKRITRLSAAFLPMDILGGGAAVFGWVGFYIGLGKTHRHSADWLVSSAVPLMIAGSALYLLGILSLVVLCRVDKVAQYRSIRGMLPAVLVAASMVVSELPSPPASPERRDLARGLITCAKRIVDFSPLIVHRFEKKVIRQQAVRASEVLQNLVYPALFGSEAELESVVSTLVKAAVKVATSNWAQIGELNVGLEQYQIVKSDRRIRWASQLNAIGLAALTAIPAVPALIEYLK